MYNIRQITNYDISNLPTTYKAGSLDRLTEYIIISNSVLGGNMVKFGYCAANPKAIGYPIYFTIKGEEKKVLIGKTGMFEVNIENYYDYSEETYKTIKPQITEIKVPKEIPFSLDYVIEI